MLAKEKKEDEEDGKAGGEGEGTSREGTTSSREDGRASDSAFLSHATRSAMARVGAKMDAALSKAMDGGRDLRAHAASAMRATYAASASAAADAEAKALAAATRARDALLAVQPDVDEDGEDDEDGDEDTSAAGPSRSSSRRSSRRSSRLRKPTAGSIAAATNRVFSVVLRRETTSALASTVCGPLWLAATQADVASVVAGAMSVYVTDASVALFLPRMRAAEEAELARRAAALTVDDGVAVVTLDVDLDDDGKLAVVAKVTAAPAPGFGVARTLARRARGGFESARGASEAAMDAAREAARGASEAAMDAARGVTAAATTATAAATTATAAATTAATAAATTAASAANVAANTTARWLSVAWSDGARAVERGADLVAASLPAAFLRNDAAGARFGERPGADEERRVGAETPHANGSGETLVDSEDSVEPVDLDEVDPDVVSALAEDPETRRVLSQPSALVRLMSDAAVAAALRDPETSRACADFVKDPSTFAERRKDPKFAAVARRAMVVASAAGGAAGVALMRKHGLLRRKTRDGGATEKVHTQEAEAEKRDASEEARESGSNTSSARETSETNSNQSATSASSAYAWTGAGGVPSLADLGGLFGASSFGASSFGASSFGASSFGASSFGESSAPTAPTRKSDAIAAKYAARAVDA